MPCPQAHHSPKPRPGWGHLLGPPTAPGGPCPESPQEMAAARRVHGLRWDIGPWAPFWRLLCSPGQRWQWHGRPWPRRQLEGPPARSRAAGPGRWPHHRCVTRRQDGSAVGVEGSARPQPRAQPMAIPRPRSCSPSAPSLPRLLPRHRDFHSSQSPAADTGLNQVEHQFQMSEFTFKTHNFWNTMAGQQRHRVLAAPSRAGPRAGRSPALLETCTHVGNFVLSLHRLP